MCLRCVFTNMGKSAKNPTGILRFSYVTACGHVLYNIKRHWPGLNHSTRTVAPHIAKLKKVVQLEMEDKLVE